MSKNPRVKNQLLKIFKAVLITAVGLVLLKWLPMRLWGSNILFDASLHISVASMVLYVLWFFVDQSNYLRTPFVGFAVLLLFIVAVQRILANAHNDIGLALGVLVSLIAISIAEGDKLKNKFKF